MVFTPNQISSITGSQPSSYTLSDFGQDFGDFIGWGSARRQREYETNMSNTAYQRMVQDMKASGLNPVMGISSGGSSTPSSGIPNPGVYQLGNIISSAAALINAGNRAALVASRNAVNNATARHLIDDYSNTSTMIFNSAGELVSRIVRDTNRYNR